jgi:hypothetical protein
MINELTPITGEIGIDTGSSVEFVWIVLMVKKLGRS